MRILLAGLTVWLALGVAGCLATENADFRNQDEQSPSGPPDAGMGRGLRVPGNVVPGE